MLDLGMQELIVIFVVALLVFGPKRLPELARTLGKGFGQVKRAMNDLKSDVEREIDIGESMVERPEIESSDRKSSGEADEIVSEKADKEDIESDDASPGSARLDDEKLPGRDENQERGA